MKVGCKGVFITRTCLPDASKLAKCASDKYCRVAILNREIDSKTCINVNETQILKILKISFNVSRRSSDSKIGYGG